MRDFFETSICFVCDGKRNSFIFSFAIVFRLSFRVGKRQLVERVLIHRGYIVAAREVRRKDIYIQVLVCLYTYTCIRWKSKLVGNDVTKTRRRSRTEMLEVVRNLY